MLQSTASFHSRYSSRKPSPSGSVRDYGSDVPIETLIAWLVAAKRSLACIHNVHRATTRLSEARSTIESTAALIARTKYLRRSLHSQLKILRGVQYEVEGAAHNIKQEIHATIRELERADKKLQNKIELLTQTRIEDGFKVRRPSPEASLQLATDQKDTLHDFVDDQPVDVLRQNAQFANAAIQETRATIDNSIRVLEDDVQRINEVLADKTATSSSTKSDLQPPNVLKQLRLLDRNAHDMAQSLESLVQHYDLCVNAIKHTEGGGAAAVKNLPAEDLPEGVDVESLQGPAESMSEEERKEMMNVLRADADQVDDVVAEIQDRGAEMELQLEHILAWRDSCETSFKDVANVFKFLERIGDRLPNHLAELTHFSSHWQEERAKIEDCIAGMQDLCEVYENFLTAYDGMIVEAGRRKMVRRQMERIVQDAQTQLDNLYDDDLNERERFRSERGSHLPSDIWQGLNILPAQYSFQRTNVEGSDSIPDLPRETVTNALRRLEAMQGIASSQER